MRGICVLSTHFLKKLLHVLKQIFYEVLLLLLLYNFEKKFGAQT